MLALILLSSTLSLVHTPSSVEDDWIGEVVQLADKRCDFPTNPNLAQLSPAFYEPKNLTEKQKVELVFDGIRSQKTPARRMVCLKILVERFPVTLNQRIESIATNGSLDIEIRKRAIWVAGIMRNENSIVWIEKLLGSMEPSIREAAIDALGFCLFPYFTEKFFAQDFSDRLGVSIGGAVPIYINSEFRYGFTYQKHYTELTDLKLARHLMNVGVATNKTLRKLGDEKTRSRIASRLTKIMLKGRTQGERIAAARALAGYQPPSYKLRVAEWGVWIQSKGKLQLAKTVLDEIPPITYQTTKQIAELKKRINQIFIVTKPVIHLKVDRPLSVSVSAFIRKGQPWFSYPQPNSFVLDTAGNNFNEGNNQNGDYNDQDFFNVKKMTDSKSGKWKPFGNQAHQGYPFLMPKAAMIGGFSGRFGGSRAVQGIRAIGVRWQHLVVNPTQLDWMYEQTLAKEYSWWTDLRKVDCSWISNGFESEKFLYYDGPTLLPSPVRVESSGSGANQELSIRFFGVLKKQESEKVDSNELQKPLALLVEVKDGIIRGKKIAFDVSLNIALLEQAQKVLNQPDVTVLTASHAAKSNLDLDGPEVKKEFLSMLQKNNGLSADEAQGLMGAWEKQFFQTDGRRLIVRIRKQDYDFQCPLKVNPKPTEISRVSRALKTSH